MGGDFHMRFLEPKNKKAEPVDWEISEQTQEMRL